MSYAVQRITEEKSRRKNNYTLSSAFGHPLNMDTGDDADQALINQRLRSSRHQDNDMDALRTQMQDSLSLIPPTSPINNNSDNATPTTPLFELSMDNATLLGRRRNTATTTTDPQSAGSGIHP